MAVRKRYALVGTGSRAEMYIDATTGKYSAVADLVAMCDLSQTRMNWHNRRLQTQFGLAARPTYTAADFDRMIAETKPDTVIVCTMDSTHHRYIIRAMELGCDVISEKPMTTDVDKLSAIFDAIRRTGKSLRVTFNYRYAPAYTRFRELIMEGVVGRPQLVDFAWILDTSHGADYFRRWHREKQNSGGLLVHKATHHFDLINWWIDSYPRSVVAMGDLMFYGKKNAEERSEHYAYTRYTGEQAAKNDPFALFLDEKEILRGLYLEAESETGYIRDLNVFGDPVTIEDTMSITARYCNGALLSYCLVAYSPWEGMRVSITGNKGRLELEVVESVTQTDGQGLDATAASTGPFKHATIMAYPMFGNPYEVDIPKGEGDHGGADPVMLDDIFLPEPPYDRFHRAASHMDGAASILLGISANESIRTGSVVQVDSLFSGLTQK